MTTIRNRVVITSSIMISGSLLIAGILVYSFVRHTLIHEFDQALAAYAQALATNVELDEADHDYEYHGAQHSETGMAFLLTSRGGKILAACGDQTLLVDVGDNTSQAHIHAQRLADGRHIRQITLWAHSQIEDKHRQSPGEPDVRIRIVSDSALLDGQLTQLAHLLETVFTVVMVLAAAFLTLAVRAALRPLDRLTAEIAGIEARSLSGRVDAEAAPAELVPAARRLNRLLDQIQVFVRKEQLYGAAIAHELRTPLAALQTILDVHRGKHHGINDYQEALELCHGISAQMRRLVQGLLLLAQADAGHLHPARETLDLTEAMTTAWAVVSHRVQDQTMDWQLPGRFLVICDPYLLAIVLSNLCDNVVSHGAPGGNIRISARVDGPWALLEIANTASHMSAEHLTHVFDRFWRGDVARSQSDRHAGLGLSLCREVMGILGGRIDASYANGWLTIVVAFAAAPSGPFSQPLPSQSSGP